MPWLFSWASVSPPRSALKSVIWAIQLYFTAYISFECFEYFLAQYLLACYPTRLSQAPSFFPAIPIYYAGRWVHYIFNVFRILRRYTPQLILPIPIPPALFALLPAYDFIIVGGGTGGAVVAGRLAAVPNVSVLLLEAGGPIVDGLLSPELLPLGSLLSQNSHRDWQYRTTPQENACLAMPNQTSFWPRGKLLGGSAALNFMIYHKGHPADYDLWSVCLNDPLWNASNVGRIFSTIEAVSDTELFTTPSFDKHVPFPRGVGGPIPVSRQSVLSSFSRAFISAAQVLGHPDATAYNSGSQPIGASPTELNKFRELGQRITSYRAYIHRHLKRHLYWDPNPALHKPQGILHIVPYAHVTRVVLDTFLGDATAPAYANLSSRRWPIRARARGVEFTLLPPSWAGTSLEKRQKKPRQIAFASREVILAAGAVGTPHLLLLSGIGPNITHPPRPSHVPHVVSVPGVGRNLMDHIFYPLLFSSRNIAELSRQLLSFSNALSFHAIRDYFFRPGSRQGILSSPGCDAQLLLPFAEKFPRAFPDICQAVLSSPNPSASVKSIQALVNARPDLQFLLYGGLPDFHDIESLLNVPVSALMRVGTPTDWAIQSLRPRLLEKVFRLSEIADLKTGHRTLSGLKRFIQLLEQQSLRGLGTFSDKLMLLPVLLHPESRGTVSLRSFNPFEDPVINPRYLTHPRDARVLGHGVEFVQQLNRSSVWRTVVRDWLVPRCHWNATGPVDGVLESDSFEKQVERICTAHPYLSPGFWQECIRLITLTLYHPSGTCRMGHLDDPMACTDSRLRVRGVDGLRIADASVFPTLVSGNTQVPVILVGEQAAGFILEDYRFFRSTGPAR